MATGDRLHTERTSAGAGSIIVFDGHPENRVALVIGGAGADALAAEIVEAVNERRQFMEAVYEDAKAYGEANYERVLRKLHPEQAPHVVGGATGVGQ